jgi:hypothetical protein
MVILNILNFYTLVVPENLFDPKIAAWICESELSSYEFIELLAHLLKKTDNQGFNSNVSMLLQDLLNCILLWTKQEELLQEVEMTEVLFNLEMKVILLWWFSDIF